MEEMEAFLGGKSKLSVLLKHFSEIEDDREAWRVDYPLAEVLFLVVCGSIVDCDDFDLISDWGEAHLDFLRTVLPYRNGVPCGRWLNILVNRIDPALFADCFTTWVRETWPEQADFVAIDGKTSRRSHDRAKGKAALHLVSAFATTRRLVLAQEAVPEKANETAAIPVLVERLGANGGLKGALVSIDAIACNGTIAGAIRDVGADYLLAVKNNQPGLRADIQALFDDPPNGGLEQANDVDKGHGRIEQRTVTVCRETDWLAGDRRLPGELRLPGAATVIKVDARTEIKDKTRIETRYYISSATLSAPAAADAVRGHWAIENSLHWVLDVTFKDDLSRVRTGHGAKNMAVVRHFAFNLVRAISDKRTLKTRRKRAAWDPSYLASILNM
ncbi:ISAs1 family transposase, partial [Roseospira visakhapatnamensis]